MSSGDGPNISNNTTAENNDNSNNKQNTINTDLLKDPFVKDLLVKIDILKNGIIKERSSNSELTSKLLKSEEELVSKTSQIKALIQDKIDLEKQVRELQTQLQQQQQKKRFFDLFNLNLNSNNEKTKPKNDISKNDDIFEDPKSVEAISTMANAEIRKLHEQISQLKFENETYLQKMNVALEQTENVKVEFKNEIKGYLEKIKSLEEETKRLEEEKGELQDRINLTSSISTQTLKETEHFKGLLYDYKKGKEDAILQLNSYVEKYKKLEGVIDSYKKEIEKHEENSVKMAKKLTELKSLYVKVNLRNQMYHVKRVGIISSPEIDIIFGRGEDGNYVMRIDKKDGMEIVNIQDVESVNRININKNKVEIKYMHKGKKITMNVLVPELVVDQFVETYKIFYFESMKNQNQINC